MRYVAAIALLTVAASALAGGCGKASDEKEAHMWADELPPPVATIPDALSIGLVVDGAARPPITAAQLRSLKPDFVDSMRQAWRVSRFVDVDTRTATVEASTPSGMSLKFPPATATLEPVLYLTRRGDLVVASVDPRNPFPRYHGLGGRLHRAGDLQPRLGGVSRLTILH